MAESDESIVADGSNHCDMDSAPPVAKEVADATAKAGPELKDTVVVSSESDENGEIL